MKTEFGREEFFDLCWEKSISWFCKNYLITYPEFKSLCTKYQIPLPPNGYWMKRKHGKLLPKPSLPKSGEIGKIELLLRTKENQEKFHSVARLNPLDNDQERNDLVVPKRLPKNPDPIIQEMLSDNPRRHPVIDNIQDYTKRYNYGEIWVSASEKPYRRALCFLNTFIKVMKARGHYFLFCYERSYVVIQGVEFAIRMRERSKRVYSAEDSVYQTSKLEPIGLLTLITGEYSRKKEWQDTPTKPLGKKLPLIINYLEDMATEERKWKVENEKRLRRQAVENKKQEERRRLQKEEIEKLHFIKKQSDLWHEAIKLRSFLNACERNDNLTEEMERLVKFGYKKANFLDPLVKGNDELFEDVDPYKLLQTIRMKN
ncbi:hypothetical protein V6B16_03825 [Salinimicrobium catena]|uniref:hypothetical protein n=1 Tax=Salinimicrobium catena TaxID=390640 RepID=UPI002FE4CB40